MIVKDEAFTLARCLDSVAGVVDEIVVVDTGSTDTTCQIAANHQAQIHNIDWPNDFAIARNFSLSHATGDWVLVLDADEVLDPSVGKQLRQIDLGEPQSEIQVSNIIAVNLLRRELDAPQAPYSLITRFFRRLPSIQFARPYHETVDDSIAVLQQQNPHWQVITLNQVAIFHTGYAPDVVIQRDKFSRAQSLMEHHLNHQPEDAYILNKLAALYLEQDRPETALPLLNQALNQEHALDALTRYELHYHRALANRYQDPNQAAIDYQQALKQDLPPRLQLGALINYGNLRKAQNDLLGAIELFQQAINADPTFAIAYYNLGVTQRLRGYFEAAIAAYRQAIALEPNYAEAYQNLGVALFKLGKLPEALNCFSRATQIYEQTDPSQAASLKLKVKALGIPADFLAANYFE